MSEELKRSKRNAKKAIVMEMLKPDWNVDAVMQICNSINDRTKDYINTGDKKIDLMIAVSANLFGTTKKQILGRSRLRENVMGRNMVYYFLRNETTKTLQSIGNVFKRDHASVHHGVTRFTDDMITNFMNVREKYKDFKNVINPEISKLEQTKTEQNGTN